MYKQSSHIEESKALELTSRNKWKKTRSVENTMFPQRDESYKHSAEPQPLSAPTGRPAVNCDSKTEPPLLPGLLALSSYSSWEQTAKLVWISVSKAHGQLIAPGHAQTSSEGWVQPCPPTNLMVTNIDCSIIVYRKQKQTSKAKQNKQNHCYLHLLLWLQ